MPAKYEYSVRVFVMKLLTVKKQPLNSIVEFTGISRKTILRWQDRGVVDPPIQRTKVTLCKKVGPIVHELLSCDCTMTQERMRLALTERGYPCCLRTVFSLFKALNISRKRIKKKRTSKNATPENLRLFKERWNGIMEDGNDIIFQDESHFSNNVLPLYGYSEKNKPCYIVEPLIRSAHTLNLAFSKSGQIFHKVYPGSICTSRMQWFVDALPPTRLLMDNHSVHKAVKMTVEKVYTPVAQPYANPVEIVFSKVKTMYRQINQRNRSMSVEEKLDMAIGTLILEDLENAIRHVDTFVNKNY